MPATRLPTRPSPSPRRRRRTLAAVGGLVVVAAFGGVACGDDDGGNGPSPARLEFAAYCEASFNLQAFFADGTGADDADRVQGARPLLDLVVPLVPADIQDPFDLQFRAFNQSLGGADPGMVFTTPEVEAARADTHDFELDNCGWNEVAVSAGDHFFSGLPDALPAGRTSLELANEGKEQHEIVVLSRNAGVAESFDQLLELPRQELMGRVTRVASAVAPPDEAAFTVVDLVPGSYLAVCLVPHGTVTGSPVPADGAPTHLDLGMRTAFTVSPPAPGTP